MSKPKTKPRYSIKEARVLVTAFSSFFITFILISYLISPILPMLHAASPTRTIFAVITRIVDGDTVMAETNDGTSLKIRLYGIDAPELSRADRPGQAFAEESCIYLSSLILGKTVRLDIWAIDRYHRIVAMIWMEEQNINLQMVSAGMAEAYLEYLKHEPYKSQFINAETEAKEKKMGIWFQGSGYERPSEFKRSFTAQFE